MRNYIRAVAATLVALCFVALTGAVLGAMWYNPAQSGHGLTVESIGDKYLATWYFHDGEGTRWVTSDVCRYGEPCQVWTISAASFPAGQAALVEAGYIALVPEDDNLRLVYSLDIAGTKCTELPAPYPPSCRGPDGRTADKNAWWVKPLAVEGSEMLDLLIE